ncbi:Syntaxin-12 [Holothuria leucospilota]|uniref:Syntaxin-7 n=1 Tax=Holothuria leucospilota TaxID=206669 RepID=A0A9Q1BUI3_HOLLE|nr:Syntaxin-12 [Holothuria leucospilota]
MTSGTGDFGGDFGHGGGFSSYSSGKSHTQDFNRLASSVGSNIQKINKNVRDIEKLTQLLGTQADTKQSRAKLDETQHYTNQLAKETNKMLKDLNAIPAPDNQSDSRQHRMQKDRLTNDFSDALNQFQRVQREAAKVERECVDRARSKSESMNPYEDDISQDPFASASFGSMDQTQMQSEDMEALVERENQLKKLESDILDVNQIFKDVATMVHEQGEMIDSIEANVESAEVHVEQANTQLVKARQYQKKARRKKFLIILCIIITLVIVALILYFILK